MLTKTQIGHFSRYFRQKVYLPKVAIIGGYHGGNLGDMALGRSVGEILNGRRINTGLQTIYNLEKWPNAPFAIIGGGAVGYIDSLQKVYARYKTKFHKIAFLGVDFNEIDYPDNILEMLRTATFVSCRSQLQAKRLKGISGREEIYFHPDIAFSLLPEFCTQARNPTLNKPNKMFVNLVPLYGKLKDGRIIPDLYYKDERPELYENFELMHANYKFAVRESVQKAILDGYEIESLPFTPEDNEYCKIVLNGLDVKFPSYQSNPIRMFEHISKGKKIISTRYHATIFGLKTGAIIQPIAYAKKNELMLNELGLSSHNFLTTTDFSLGKNKLPQGFIANERVIDNWENGSRSMIENCVNALLG